MPGPKKAPKKAMPKPDPCPCCGNKKLYTGPIMAMTQGIECMPYLKGCGLQLGRVYPMAMPRGVKDLKGLNEYLLRKAILAWNRRTTVKS